MDKRAAKPAGALSKPNGAPARTPAGPAARHAGAGGVAQPKAAAAPHAAGRSPQAPPAYRPQPLQKCLQAKRPAGFQPPQVPARPPAPQPARTPTPPQAPPRPNAGGARAAVQRHGARPKPPAPNVVQATKLYPNLHPGAVESVDPGSLYRLESFTDQYRLRKTGSHGAYVPNQQYNFVRTSEGQMLLHNRYRHPSIAEGRQVLYAGEVYFNNGRLEWWSNGSGHYQPDSEDAQQAALPMDSFYTYQQIIKGEHKRKG
jgi:hypothetical protein